MSIKTPKHCSLDAQDNYLFSETTVKNGNNKRINANQSLGITKAGNKNLRRLLIEAAQSMSHSQKCGKKSLRLLARQKDMNPLVIAYADIGDYAIQVIVDSTVYESGQAVKICHFCPCFLY